MDKAQYKTERIERLGRLYLRPNTAKTEWDKCIAMECGDLPYPSRDTTGFLAVLLLLSCRLKANEIDSELARFFPKMKNTGRAKRMAAIFSNGKCRNVTVYREHGLLGLKWDRYRFFDQRS